MSYSEFELIRRCFVDEGLGFDRDGVVLGIGDDAAIVQPPNGMAIALSLDTLVEGVHFLKHAPARLLARRALAVNLSDIAAMGAEPLCFTLGLTLPESDDGWVAEFAAGLKIGQGIDEGTDIGPIISARQAERIAGFLSDGPAEGATVLTGGQRAEGAALEGGHFIQPTVFGGVTDDMRIAREEIFGPVISALPFDDLDEVVARANDTPYGLAAGVFSTNLGTAHKLAHRLKAGSVWVNMYHAIDPAVPFGGVKMSGYGREGGTEHLEEYLDTKAIWINAD